MFFLKNYKIVIFIVIILSISLIMLSYNFKNAPNSGFVRKIVLEIAAPVQHVLNASARSVGDAWSRYIFLVGLEDENKNLKKKINELKADLILYQEGYLEAERLKKLLSIKDDYEYHLVSVRVIGREQAALSKTILINKGSAQGLRVGMPVLAEPGLIGRIIDISWHAAKVLLLIDESSNIDAIVQRSRVQGIINGAGSRGCIMKYVSKAQDVKESDIIVSSGLGGVFPKGLMLGVVSAVDRQESGLFLKIKIAPSIDFSKLEEVSVLASDDKDKGE
jgi:rod shape-determining protein MreC